MAEGGTCLETPDETDSQYHDINNKISRDELSKAGSFSDTWCDPCHRKHIYMPASEYCPVCMEYYCTDCSDCHSRFALGRNHTTLAGADMPKICPEKPLQYEQCNFHLKYSADKFCAIHREMICTRCASDSHIGCDIKSIPDVSVEVDSSAVSKFKCLLQETRKDVHAKLSIFEQNISELENQRKLSVHKLKSTYDAVKYKVDKLFKEATDELERVYNKIKTYLLYQTCSLNKFIANIENSLKNLDKLKRVDVKSFLHLQNIAKSTREDVFKINEISRNVRKRGLKASVNEKLQDFVEATLHLGMIDEVSSDYKITKSIPLITFPVSASTDDQTNGTAGLSKANMTGMIRFSAKLPDDKKECGIVGLDVTPDGRVIVADFLNMNIKCFEQDRKYQSSLTMQYQPSDLAVMNNDDVIVSLWCQNELHLLDIGDDDIKVRKEIKVESPVSAVSVCKDKIIVNCREGSGSVKLIDKTGKVYWSRSIDCEENELFKYPRCNTCFSYKRKLTVAVTDYNKRTITKLSGRTGDVKTVCRLDEKDPFGVTHDKKGNIYVCYRETNEIAVWSEDMETQKIILSENDGLGMWPNCIKHVGATNQLFVCYSGLKDTNSRNFIDCYQLAETVKHCPEQCSTSVSW